MCFDVALIMHNSFHEWRYSGELLRDHWVAEPARMVKGKCDM
jgi:hypothetical protein